VKKRWISFAMVVIGVGLAVIGFSDYVPAGAGADAGWSDSCRNCMTIGAMLAVGGWRLP
jgi:hypothetical protein